MSSAKHSSCNKSKQKLLPIVNKDGDYSVDFNKQGGFIRKETIDKPPWVITIENKYLSHQCRNQIPPYKGNNSLLSPLLKGGDILKFPLLNKADEGGYEKTYYNMSPRNVSPQKKIPGK